MRIHRGPDHVLVACDLRFAANHISGIGTHGFCLLDALLEPPGDDRLVLWNASLAPHSFRFRRPRSPIHVCPG